MALPIHDDNIVRDGQARLIFAFQKPNILAFLGAILDEDQQLENAITDPNTGYLNLIQLANAQTDTLNKYGKIVDYPRGFFNNNEYRVFINIKIAVDSSNASGDAILNILQLAAFGPFAVRDFDNYGFGSFVDIQGGYTPYALAYINLLPKARGGGVAGDFRYWTWNPVVPNSGTSLGLFTFGSTIGTVANATGFKDAVSGTFNNALASVALV